jgi:hypothetical protein
MIQKYFLHVPSQKKNHYCVELVILFLIKIKHQSFIS